jgi:hypothetical protein
MALAFLVACPSFAARPPKKAPAARQSATSAASKTVPRAPKKTREVSSTVDSRPVEAPQVATSFQAVTGTNPSFLFSSGFGVHVLSKPGVALQGQLMFATNHRRNYYVGPDFTYTLFSPGTSLTTALGGWYDLKIYGAPRLACLFGLVAGPVFNAGVAGYSNTTLAVFLDLALVQEVDDLISVKGQFRPGVLGGTFTYVMSFQVAFRFL